MNIAIIFAGGKGERMGANIPKQFLEINGKPILVHTAEKFEYHKEIDKIYIATIKEYIPYVNKLVQVYNLTKVCGVVEGGETALDSAYKALIYASKENESNAIVLLHDGVRPFVSAKVIHDNIESVKKYGNAITCFPAYETVITSKDGNIVENVTNRGQTYTAKAPQSFIIKDIIQAHIKTRNSQGGFGNNTDACSIMREQGEVIHMVIEEERTNIKITTPADFYMAKAFVEMEENQMNFGIGNNKPLLT